MNKLSPRQQAEFNAAEGQRRLCRDWLLYIMTASSEKTRTKADLRDEAIELCGLEERVRLRLDLGDRGDGESSLVRAAAALRRKTTRTLLM
jgi:hypothetical protein